MKEVRIGPETWEAERGEEPPIVRIWSECTIVIFTRAWLEGFRGGSFWAGQILHDVE